MKQPRAKSTNVFIQAIQGQAGGGLHDIKFSHIFA